jgi:cell pole-organizing protein PopZ
MEEILASIRRIIEDSDGGRRQPVDAAVDMPASEAVDDTPEAGAAIEAAAPEVEVFRAELRAGRAGVEPDKPISLAEVQAQLAGGQPGPALRGSTAPATSAPTLAEIGARAGGGIDNPPVSGRAEAPAADGQHEPATVSELTAPDFLPGPDEGEGGIELDDDDLVFHDESEQTAQTAVIRSTLVSEETSRQVAAAFGELSEAFASRGKKSIDEMAEEMLRPMLQDWLDNNLPTLVERLVREEIERVARGGA